MSEAPPPPSSLSSAPKPVMPPAPGPEATKLNSILGELTANNSEQQSSETNLPLYELQESEVMTEPTDPTEITATTQAE